MATAEPSHPPCYRPEGHTPSDANSSGTAATHRRAKCTDTQEEQQKEPQWRTLMAADIRQSNYLTDLAARIRAEHDATAEAFKSSIAHGIAAGALLMEAKTQGSHGQWLMWLKANCAMSECQSAFKFDPRSASNFAAFWAGKNALRKLLTEFPTSWPKVVSDPECGYGLMSAPALRSVGFIGVVKRARFRNSGCTWFGCKLRRWHCSAAGKTSEPSSTHIRPDNRGI